MDTKAGHFATSTSSCQANDWAGTWRGLAIWGSAAFAVLLGDQFSGARAWLWFAGFLVAGVGCVANAARCGRRHCYFMGPACLLAAIYVGLAGLHVLPMDGTVFWGVLVVVLVLARLSEPVLGRYARKT